MSNLIIGRIGVDLDLDPSRLTIQSSERGHVLTIEGEVALPTPEDSVVLRNQLAGLSENSVALVPITFSEDSSIDGYYTVRNVRLDMREASMSGYYPFRLYADRVGSDGMVALESKLTVGLRANNHSITPGEPFWAIPQDATPASYSEWFGSEPDSAIDRDVDDPVATVMSVGLEVPSTAKSVVYGLEAAMFNGGAAKLETGPDLNNLSVVAGLDCENTPLSWRVSNGMIRCRSIVEGNYGRVYIEHYDGTSWVSGKTWSLYTNTSTIVGEWNFISVIRNDPAAVTIRTVSRQGDHTKPVYLDITLRRGSRFVEFRASVDRNAPATTWRIVPGTTASSLITGGLRATSNDGDGNRQVHGTSKSFTYNLTTGMLQVASTTTFDYFIGSEIGGSGAQAGDQSADLVKQYMGFLTETIGPVMR